MGGSGAAARGEEGNGPLLLGIDAGTSVLKAVLFDGGFRVVAIAARAMPASAPRTDWSEVGMEEVWRRTTAAMREVLAGREARRVAAVGVSGCMVGAWLIDAEGRPVRPGILWNDGRTQDLIDAFEAECPGFNRTIYDSSGSVMQQGCTLPLLAWLARHEPEVLARSVACLGAKDWLRFKLTGTIASDPTEASVAPGDARGRGRSEAMIDIMGLRPWRHLLPEPRLGNAIAGTVTPEAAETTGLLAGTPVAIGAGDVGATVLGAGATRPGTAITILGTTCLVGLSVARPLFEPRDLGLLFCTPGGGWFRAMVNVAGTTNLDWAMARLRVVDPSAAEALASSVPRGAEGVLYLPYLSPVGIIAPVVDAGARAAIAGLHDRHGDGHLLRAVYEGVALAIRDCYDAMAQPLDEIRLVGGGARSGLWRRLVADCTGRPVLTFAETELGARGAAILAAQAIGLLGPDEVPAPSIASRTEPDPEATAFHDAQLQRYRSLARALRPEPVAIAAVAGDEGA
ncbi:MAG: FGGY-family carbohydrate kinase [Geminicoccaceae bacterium]